MAIGALHFHSREQLSSTHRVFTLIGRFLLTTDTQVERISQLAFLRNNIGRISSSSELLAVSGLVISILCSPGVLCALLQ